MTTDEGWQYSIVLATKTGVLFVGQVWLGCAPIDNALLAGVKKNQAESKVCLSMGGDLGIGAWS